VKLPSTLPKALHDLIDPSAPLSLDAIDQIDIPVLNDFVKLVGISELLTILTKLDGAQNSTLAFDNVSFVYDNVPYLSNVTGVIKPGELVGVLGSPDSGGN
jgi:ABC-type multidrug transport system fused ATPase/permease subunit